MQFIILLISLTLERYVDKSRRLAAWLYRLDWLERYLNWIPTKHLQGFKGLVLALGGPLVVVLLVLFLSSFSLPLRFITQLFLLFYCIHWEDSLPPTVLATNQIAAQTTLWQFEERTFAVIFWYACCGPSVAAIYRLLTLLRQVSIQAGGRYAELVKPVRFALSVLDWLPVRALGLLAALVGNFTASFQYWLEHLMSGLPANSEFLGECGVRSLTLEQQSIVNADQQPVQALLDRSLLLFIAMVFTFTLGTWIYRLA